MSNRTPENNAVIELIRLLARRIAQRLKTEQTTKRPSGATSPHENATTPKLTIAIE